MIIVYRKKGEVDGQRHSKECLVPSDFQSLLKQERSGHIKIMSVSHPNKTKPGRKEIVKDDSERGKRESERPSDAG